MKITRFNHAAVNIHGKTDEAREFYTELLGLPEVPIQLPGRPPVPKGTVQAFWLELGGCQVHAIGAPMKGELREPTGPHVSWYVPTSTRPSPSSARAGSRCACSARAASGSSGSRTRRATRSSSSKTRAAEPARPLL